MCNFNTNVSKISNLDTKFCHGNYALKNNFVVHKGKKMLRNIIKKSINRTLSLYSNFLLACMYSFQIIISFCEHTTKSQGMHDSSETVR